MRRRGQKRLAKVGKANFARFGCVLEPAGGIFHIDWPKNYRKEASGASVLAEGIYHKSEMGRVFCLALEISTIRFLPRYCYWPFDLSNHSQRTALHRIVSDGVLRCAFDSSAKIKPRVIRIPPRQLSRLSVLHRDAIADSEAFTTAKSNFKKALAELEQAERLPTFFARVFSENEFRSFEENVRKEASKLGPQKIASAQKLIQDLFDVPRKRYVKETHLLLENLPDLIWFSQFVADLYREYGNDYPGAVEAVAAVVATSSSEEELKEAFLIPVALDALCELVGQLRSVSTIKNVEMIPRLTSMLTSLRSRLSAGKGLSQEFIRNTLMELGPEVLGQPGRLAGDYSHVQTLRESGHSWREIAQILFESDLDLQKEFGAREFSGLRPDQREHLQHRINQGYRDYRHRIKRTALPASVPKPA